MIEHKLGELIIGVEGETNARVLNLQLAFVKQLQRANQLSFGKLAIDNTALREGTIGVACYINLATGKCGFSHVLPSEVVEIFKAQSALRNPKLHWWSAYQGDALPNPVYPFPVRKPWKEKVSV